MTCREGDEGDIAAENKQKSKWEMEGGREGRNDVRCSRCSTSPPRHVNAKEKRKKKKIQTKQHFSRSTWNTKQTNKKKYGTNTNRAAAFVLGQGGCSCRYVWEGSARTQRSACFIVGTKEDMRHPSPSCKKTAMATITSSTDSRQHNAIERLNTHSGQTIKSARHCSIQVSRASKRRPRK